MRNLYSITWLWLAVLATSAIFTLEKEIFTHSPTTAACQITLSAGNDQTICKSGVVNLSASITGSYLSAIWSPAQGITDTTLVATTARVDSTTTYRMTVRSLNDQNLITNGDFEGGNNGFTSDYSFTNSDLRPEGRYAIVRRANDVRNSFSNCSDHSGNGFMMVVNASGQSNNVWCKTITISSNSEYIFGAWAASMVSQNPARLQFSINGSLIGTVFTASAQTCNWREFTANWKSGAASTAQLCVANVNNTAAGNDFAIDDLSFRQICVTTDDVTITVTNVKADWNARTNYCKNEVPITLDSLLTPTTTRGGAWTIDGSPATTLNPAQLTAGNYKVRYTVKVATCEEMVERTITISAPVSAGVALPPLHVCVGTDTTIALKDLLQGEDNRGIWAQTLTPIPANGTFNAGLGTFRTAGQQAATYNFMYQVDAPGSCPDESTTVQVVVEPSPVANAGEDLALSCNIDMVTIGSSPLPGNNILYSWTAAGGSIIPNPDIPLTEVNQADTYILLVTNTNTGCTSSDEVSVTVNISKPSATVQLKPLTCNQPRDGAIKVMATGVAPFEYALDDGKFSSKNEFQTLAPGNYNITIRDGNGCDTTLQATLLQTENLDVELQANAEGDIPTVPRGDSLKLTILSSKPTDQLTKIIWNPDSIGCATCTTIYVKPQFSTTYTIRVTDTNGCVATDQLEVFVQKVERVYIPTAFSPNGDGANDKFYISAGQEVKEVKNFYILNRWGTMVYSRSNFEANTPDAGWDGHFNGTLVQNGVYVYVAELEMADGEIIVVKGDVTVLK